MFTSGSKSRLNIDLKEDSVGRRSFQFEDFSRSGSNALKAADSYPIAAALAHLQMPHGRKDSRNVRGLEGRMSSKLKS